MAESSSEENSNGTSDFDSEIQMSDIAREDMGEQQTLYESTNIYSDEFKQELMGFCHYYQIPFLDSNIPKSTKNAAKIYNRILQDGKDVI